MSSAERLRVLAVGAPDLRAFEALGVDVVRVVDDAVVAVVAEDAASPDAATAALPILAPPFDVAILRAQLPLLAQLRDQRTRVRDLEGERERLRSLFHQLPAGIAILRGPELVYELSSATNQALLGHREVLGKRLEEAVPELVAQGFRELAQHVYETGEPFHAHEMPAQLFDDQGSARPVYLNGGYQPLRRADGTIEGIFGFAYEVTDLVLARKRAEASEARFRHLYDSGIIGVVFWSRDGELVDANDAFIRMVGYTREELREHRVGWRAMTPPEFAHLDERAIEEMDERGFSTPFEKEYLHKDGRRIPILIGCAFWEGSHDGGIAWILDQTERNAAMAREREARATAEAAVRRRDEFLSIASHELKTPLTSLSLNLSSIERAFESDRDPEGRTGDRLARMRTQLARLTRLVDQLLDVGRLERGLPPRRAETDLVELARGVIERFEDEARATQTPLVLHAPDTLVGMWDRDRLDQVLTNLVANAVKYGRGTRVDVEIATSDDSARLVVRDRGIGIDAAEHARIFERFERATSARNYGGLGLGLYIAREIARAHGGRIEVESAPGEGAAFALLLPREA